MTTPFALSQCGYQPDPKNPLRFISTQGHPFYPVTLPDERHKNSGVHMRSMLEAAHAAGKGYGVAFSAAEIIRQTGDVETARGLLRVWSVDPALMDPNDLEVLEKHGLITKNTTAAKR
jgi:hypothetical protein